MPSTKRRINLTVPEDIYERIQSYRKECGIQNDATACLQLVVQQLNSYETSKVFVSALRALSADQLQSLASEGVAITKAELDK